MQKFLAQWRAFSAADRSQYIFEIWGLVSLGVFMTLVGITFAGAPTAAVFNRIGGTTMAWFLASASLVCVLLVPLMLVYRRPLSVYWKRRIYIYLMTPAAFYAVSVFLFARDTGNVSTGVVTYVMFINLLSLVGVTLYREG